MNHLTLTGPMAGTPYCGNSRNTDDDYSHLPYGTKSEVESYVKRFVDCAQCRSVYNDVYETSL